MLGEFTERQCSTLNSRLQLWQPKGDPYQGREGQQDRNRQASHVALGRAGRASSAGPLWPINSSMQALPVALGCMKRLPLWPAHSSMQA